MADFITSQIVTGILECDAAKQELGQRLARHLRLEGGPGGRDDGIDGFAVNGTYQILFQSKLRKNSVGPDDAKIFWADLLRHKKNVGIYVAGVGYTAKFLEVSRQIQDVLQSFGCDISTHYLTLADLLERTEALRVAAAFLPPLGDVAQAVAKTT